MGCACTTPNMEPEKLFELIDINNNGSFSQKELLGFVFCLFKVCEDDKEKAAAKLYALLIMKVAEANNLEDRAGEWSGEIKLEMLKDDAIMGKALEQMQADGVNQDDIFAGAKSIMAGLTEMGEDAIKEMLGQAAKMGLDELDDFVLQEM